MTTNNFIFVGRPPKFLFSEGVTQTHTCFWKRTSHAAATAAAATAAAPPPPQVVSKFMEHILVDGETREGMEPPPSTSLPFSLSRDVYVHRGICRRRRPPFYVRKATPFLLLTVHHTSP